jgi:hypothetical protein
MVVISRSEIERMKKNVLPDCDTEYWGMTLTEFDIFEHNHSNEDWEIIEDMKEENDG